MKLLKVSIENFRGLEDIEFEVSPYASVIVGPNAVGKTSVLEAIRLCKALLMPTSQNEGQTVLQTLGAFSPHQNRTVLENLCGNPEKTLKVGLIFEMTNSDIEALKKSQKKMTMSRVKNSLAQTGQNDLILVQYLASPQGKQNYTIVDRTVIDKIKEVERTKKLSIEIKFEDGSMKAKGQDQEIYSVLESLVSPGISLMSYFPADRALPAGEVNIQIGSADLAAQIQSHLAQPASKYQRLKQYIVNKSLTSPEMVEELRSDFNLIFKELLPGKELVNVTLNQIGTVSVLIRDIASGAIFDIDNMSSGEKGLILTFFLMRRCVAKGGIVLLDEPELHLNATVCRKILPFLIEHFLIPNDCQVILCTHSPEILASSYDRDDCNLYHLRSGKIISKVIKKDKREIFEVLERLGSSKSDVLSFRGSIFVEGPDDIELLEAGFFQTVSGYKLADLGGRNEVEKEIRILQKTEQEGALESSQVFIFDLDRRPTNLKSSKLVKIVQWDRYCLENYLLDSEIIKLVCDEIKSTKTAETSGKIKNDLKTFALQQIIKISVLKAYEEMEPKGLAVRIFQKIDSCETIAEASELISGILNNAKTSIGNIDVDNWKLGFTECCNRKKEALEIEWAEEWVKQCNGKLVLEKFYYSMGLTISIKEFKKKIMKAMLENQSENLKTIEGQLTMALRQ